MMRDKIAQVILDAEVKGLATYQTADAIIAELPGMVWQPIETAPKDETWILAQDINCPLPAVVRWCHLAEGWIDPEDEVLRRNEPAYGALSHWMPLPGPPTQNAKD